MTTSIVCPTPRAIILLALVHQDQVFRFPFADGELPGLEITLQQGASLLPHLVSAVHHKCRELVEGFSLEVVAGFSAPISAQPEATLYLVRSRDPLLCSYFAAKFSLATFPELLRGMAKTKQRAAYLQAWQYLMGAHVDQLYALTTEEVTKILQEDQE